MLEAPPQSEAALAVDVLPYVPGGGDGQRQSTVGAHDETQPGGPAPNSCVRDDPALPSQEFFPPFLSRGAASEALECGTVAGGQSRMADRGVSDDPLDPRVLGLPSSGAYSGPGTCLRGDSYRLEGKRGVLRSYTEAQVGLLVALSDKDGTTRMPAPAWLVDRVLDAMGKSRIDQLSSGECDEVVERLGMIPFGEDVPAGSKQCTACRAVLLEREFYAQERGADGLAPQCKHCAKERSTRARKQLVGG